MQERVQLFFEQMEYGSEQYGGNDDEADEAPKVEFVFVPDICVERIQGFSRECRRDSLIIEYIHFMCSGKRGQREEESGKSDNIEGPKSDTHIYSFIINPASSFTLPPSPDTGTFFPGLNTPCGSNMRFTSAKSSIILGENM